MFIRVAARPGSSFIWCGKLQRPHMETANGDAATERLLLRLRALASPVRLQILRALVVPSRSQDLRVRATGERAGFDAQRFLGRSTVIEHLDILEAAHLVRRVGEAYVVDQQEMVAFLQDLGDLARLRAIVEVDVETTRPTVGPPSRPLVPPPRLLIVNGPKAGQAFALTGAGPWRVGRDASCEVALAHDPHVSRLHVTLSREEGGLLVESSMTAKNAALVDFAPLEPGQRVPVRPGSILGVGATSLSVQL